MSSAIGRILLSNEETKLETYLTDLISPLSILTDLADDLRFSGGKSVYFEQLKPADSAYRVCRIHFYYFKIKEQKLIAEHFFYSEPNGDINLSTDFMHEIIRTPYPDVPGRKRVSIAETLKDLLENARSTDRPLTKPTGNPVNRIRFQERAFLAFCFDHTDWVFPDDPQSGTSISGLPSVYFTEDAQLTKNHSFFDGKTAQIANDDGTVTPIFYMVNHSKRNNAGTDLNGSDNQPVKFNIVVKVPIVGTTEKLTVIFDPGGNNLGPPEPPL
jgi:hypothetical protein